MHWAPVHSRQSGRWTPEWVCMRCNSTVDENHPLLQGVPAAPVCSTHGPAGLHWIYASSAAAGSAAAVRPQKFSPALANASCSPNQLSLRPTLLRMSRLHPPPQRTTVPHLPTQPGHAKAPLTRWRVGAHIAGCSCLCCMPRSVAFTPMRLMLGKPMLIMHRCGNAPLTFFARPRLCSPLLWCTRCIPCST